MARVINGIFPTDRAFLNAGLFGFIIADGEPTYYSENITEIYYQTKIANPFFISGDYQFVRHPACNEKRGPLDIFDSRGYIGF
ncbi:MAG: carbohydrate porin [Ferruginibacter sp.]|nr:carbohydrate porin [Ferruginibacter sp.]